MGFDDVDRQFRPKTIKLECVGCGVTRDVAPRTPWYWEWSGHPPPLPLCPECEMIDRPPLIFGTPGTQPSLL